MNGVRSVEFVCSSCGREVVVESVTCGACCAKKPQAGFVERGVAPPVAITPEQERVLKAAKGVADEQWSFSSPQIVELTRAVDAMRKAEQPRPRWFVDGTTVRGPWFEDGSNNTWIGCKTPERAKSIADALNAAGV